VELDSLGPFERLWAHKTCLRHASELALKRILDSDKLAKEPKYQVLTTATTALWFDSPELLPRIHRNLPMLKDIIIVGHDGRVQLKDALRIQALVAQATREHLDNELRLTIAETPRSKTPRTSSSLAITRWQRLWSPFNSRVVLDGVARNGSVVYSARDQARVLKPSTWALLKTWSGSIKHTSFVGIPPSIDDVCNAIKSARHSAPGPDGLPYASWKAGTEKAATTLAHVQQAMCLRGVPTNVV
jgi:hypothetical protein